MYTPKWYKYFNRYVLLVYSIIFAGQLCLPISLCYEVWMGWKPLPEDICHFNNRKIHLWPNMSLNLISREHNTNSVLPSRTLPSRTHPREVYLNSVLPSRTLPSRTHPSEVYLNSVLPSRTLPSRTHPCTSSLPSWSALILSRAALAVSASPNLTQAYGFSIKVFVSFTLKSNHISISIETLHNIRDIFMAMTYRSYWM